MPTPIYRPKAHPAETASLTPLAKAILRAAADRTGIGKSNVIEHLLRVWGGSLSATEFQPLDDDAAAA